MQIARCNNHTSLRIHLVNVVLRCGQIDILYAITAGVDERLSEDLLRNILVVENKRSREESFEEKTELRTADDGRIHIMVCLVAISVVRPSPGDGVSLV